MPTTPPAFGSAGAQLQGTAADFQVAVPSGVAANDIVVVTAFIDSTGSITGLPAGFANVAGSPVIQVTAPGNHRMYVAWKRASGADAGTYDFTLSGSVYRNVQAIRYTGAITSGDPWDDTDAASLGVDGSPSPDVSVTTTLPNCLVVWAATNWASGNWTQPAGFDMRRNTGDKVCSVADMVQATAGSSGIVTGSCAGSGKRCAWLGALKGITTGGDVSRDLDATYYANQLAGTIVGGVPTLTYDAALCVAAGIPLTNTGTTAANVLAGTTNLTTTGALNVAAGTYGLEDALCLYVLNGGTI